MSTLKRLPIDIDEHDGLMPRQAIHPDRRCHGSRARIDALPHAARRSAITPARRHLALAFFEAVVRECIHNLLWRHDPSVLLEVVKRVAKEELENEHWLRMVARLSDRSYEQVRVMVLEFLDTDIFNLSVEHCVSFLDPLIDSWDIDLATFDMEVVLNRRLASGPLKKFGFVEREPEQPFDDERGLKEFLQDTSLSGDATEEEIEFLKKLRFKRKRPTPLYYYRELQNFRDPLHFRTL